VIEGLLLEQLPVVRSERDSLSLLDRGRQLIAEAKAAADVKEVRDKAAAVQRYMRQQRFALEAIQDAGELKLRAERRLGELLRETVRPGNPQLSHGATIGRLPAGVSRSQSHRWQRVASVPEDVFEGEIAAARQRKQELTTATVLKLAGAKVKRQQRDELRRRMAEAAPPSDVVRTGDFRKVLSDLPDGSVDLVFTDPPYRDYALYGAVAELAARVLRPGGSLVAYSPTYAVADVLPLMTPWLDFWSLIVVKHAGTNPHLNQYRLIAACKSLLWFVKGRYEGEWVFNLITSTPPDKGAHDWQQSEAEAEYCIERMSSPGGLVVDPMCGSGTTLAAALRLGRRALGVEIDEERAKVASARLGARESAGERAAG
jgi:16S rRNA G966 N2-methylase RsmD